MEFDCWEQSWVFMMDITRQGSEPRGRVIKDPASYSAE
jgi:hypothetical protein